MAPLTRLIETYAPPRPVISPNGHKQYRVILDPQRPELTIDEVFDDLERREVQAMRRQPDDRTVVLGYHVNLWAMPNGWWLADTLGVEGNRVQGESKAEAIELTELGIEMAHDEV